MDMPIMHWNLPMQVTRTVVMDIYKTQEHPDRYTDEYKEDIKQFYM